MTGGYCCSLIMCREKACLLLWCAFVTVVSCSTGFSTITVLSDGNRTDCSRNSTGMFCYSLSYALNHEVTNNTVLFIASPEVGVFDNTSVTHLRNISIRGLGISKTVICYYHFGISFLYVEGLQISDLTIQHCNSKASSHMHHQENKSNVTNEMDLYIKSCSDVTIDSVLISKLTSGGLALYCPFGHIRILNSIFQHNYSPRAGVSIFTCHTVLVNITIDTCVFHANQNHRYYTSPRSGSGHGGGMLLQFDFANYTHTSIINCLFTDNIAPWGGGLYVGYRLGDAVKNTLVIKDTNFLNNTAIANKTRDSLGGGGMDIGMYEMKQCIANSDIIIDNVTFYNNSAWYGGGTSIYSDTCNQPYHLNYNKLIFINCRWIENRAYFSTAVDVSPFVYNNAVESYPLQTKFVNCSFIRNMVWEDKQSKNKHIFHFHSGTVMITVLQVEFCENTRFENNVGTALHIVATKIIFSNGSNVTFESNNGNKGGALALVGMANLQFNSHSTFLFQNNYADFVGGAIYWYSIDQHDYFSSRTCFLEPRNSFTNNVSFLFYNNSAHSGIGQSIYATTLLPCQLSCKQYAANFTSIEIFNKCVANFTFDDGDDLKMQISTSGSRLSMPTIENNTLKVTPGITTSLNTTVYDEYHNNVTSISVFQNSVLSENTLTSNITLAPSYQYSSLSEVIMLGTPGSKGKLLIQTESVQGVSTVLNIEIAECPPGLVFNEDQNKCECNQVYSGIVCNTSGAYINEGYWAGYLQVNNEINSTPSNLWTAPCPLTFCSYGEKPETVHNAKFFLLPTSANSSALDEFVCGAYRTGEACGQCRENFSVFFHSRQYSCKRVTYLCNFGMFFYIISELLPLTLLFIVILASNISFTSGAVNGFILFAQIIDLLYIDVKSFITICKAPWLIYIYQFIYGFFNLDFFSSEKLSFCLWKRATVLDVLVFKYVTTVFAVLLIFGLVVLVNYCACWNVCKCCRKQGFCVSMIQGLSAFLVMAYSQSTRVTFEILQPALLRPGLSNVVKYVVRLDGSVEYFSWHHLGYAIPAILFLVIIVVLPPSLLLLNPLLMKVVAFMQTRNYCYKMCSKRLLNKVLLIELKPLFDSFQGCFKDSCRFFAGIYFVYRLVILLIRVISPTLSSFYIATEFFLIFSLVFHSSVQPYQKRWHNILDTITFGNLVVINGISCFQNTMHGKGSVFIRAIQLFLIYCPIAYILIYTTIMCVRKYTKKHMIMHQVPANSSTYNTEDEMPVRLLSNCDDSYNSF